LHRISSFLAGYKRYKSIKDRNQNRDPNSEFDILVGYRISLAEYPARYRILKIAGYPAKFKR
jgi:hypothetical protein